MPNTSNSKLYFSEFFGTFSLVFAGTGAIVIDYISQGQITHLGVGLTFGLVIMVMIYSLGDVSGAHFNPAVTLGFWAAKKLPGKQALPYVLSQTAGALAASALIRVLFGNTASLGATLPAGPVWQSFVLEVILTWILMFVILHVSTGAKEKGIMAGAAIGATVGLEAIFAGPISGASMNPARSLGPALVSGNLSALWLYVAAPVIGALLAVVCCKITRAGECCDGSC